MSDPIKTNDRIVNNLVASGDRIAKIVFDQRGGK